MEQISFAGNMDLNLMDVKEIKPDNYIDIWRSIAAEDHQFSDEHVKIAAVLSTFFVSKGNYNLFESFLEELDPEKMTILKKDEQFLRALIQLKMHQTRFKEVIALIKEGEFQSPEDLIDIWDEAHYKEKEKLGQSLTSLEKFRIRKRNPPPVNICPLGRQLKTIPGQARATLRRWYDKHTVDPYPSKLKKLRLAEKTGLSLTQVKTWFSNARRNRRQKRLSKKTETKTIKRQPAPKIKPKISLAFNTEVTEWKLFEVVIDNQSPTMSASQENKPRKQETDLINVGSDPKSEPADIQNPLVELGESTSNDKTMCPDSVVDETDEIAEEFVDKDADKVTECTDKDSVLCESSEPDTQNALYDKFDQNIKPITENKEASMERSLAVSKKTNDKKELNNKSPERCHNMYMNKQCSDESKQYLDQQSQAFYGVQFLPEHTGIDHKRIIKEMDFTEFHQERIANTAEDIAMPCNNLQMDTASVNTDIKSLLKQKLNKNKNNTKSVEQINQNHKINVLGGDSSTQASNPVENLYNSYDSLISLSEICNRIDPEFSYNSSTSGSAGLHSHGKTTSGINQKVKKLERYKKAWAESLKQYGGISLSMEWYGSRQTSSRNYKHSNLNYDMNQITGSWREQGYTLGLNKSYDNTSTPSRSQLNYPTTSHSGQQIMSPRTADDAETGIYMTDFHTSKDFRQTAYQGYHASDRYLQPHFVEQSGDLQQTVPSNNSSWQPRAIYPNRADVVSPYPTQPYVPGNKGNTVSDSSSFCYGDYAENMYQIPVFCGSYSNYQQSTRPSSQINQSPEVPNCWSSPDAMIKSSVDEAVQGLLNLSSQESDP